MAEPSVGSRVVIARELATVRYIGPVEKQQGTWIGVEWDDSSRGKHDGSTGGVKYFSCLGGQNAGSFVRAEKVNFGTSLVQAIVSRYTNERAEGFYTVSADDMFVQTSQKRMLQVNLVGEEKVKQRQSQMQLLTHARVVKAYVSHLGDAAELQQSMPHLKELDVSDNLVSGWAFAVSVCHALPTLQLLNLSDNRLALVQPDGGAWPHVQLKTLILNRCHISWAQVVSLQCYLPQLEQLHLCGNNISSLDCPHLTGPQHQQQQHHQADQQPLSAAAAFSSLKVLNLEDNAVADWQQVALLAGLPALSRLHLSNNPLQQLQYPQQQQGQQQQPFAQLTALLLGNCRLASWAHVDQLDLFPALQELRLSGNPLLEGAKSGGRFEVIGRVSRLLLLNGSDVKPRERHDAELRYLQNIMAQLEELSSAEERAAAQQQHPRLKPLLAKYGAVSGTSSSSSAQGSTLNAGLVSLLLVCPGGSSHMRRLPRALTLANLRLLLDRLCGVAAERQSLCLRESDGRLVELAGDDSRQLAYYEVQDGCTIVVGEEEPELRLRQMQEAAALQRALQEALIAAQLRDVERIQAAASKLVV